MCGLVGYVGNVSEKLIERCVEESKVRGLHYLGKYIVAKEGLHYTSYAGIYHTRYCTSGEDNQPIVMSGVALAMNGVIHMGTKAEMEKEYSIKMKTDNDAEVLLQYLHTYSFEDLCEMWTDASIAAIMLNKKKLLAFRNSKRPLWAIDTGTKRCPKVLIASTLDILKRAGANYRAAKLLTSNRMYSWTI